jgi:hypothetical protein
LELYLILQQSANSAAPTSESWTDTANVVIAFVALAIAAASFVFTKLSLETQRKHNRLSVRPIPYLRKRRWNSELLVRLENQGVGPLLVKVLTVTSGDKSYGDVISLLGTIPDPFKYEYTQEHTGRVIPVGDHLTFFEIKGSDAGWNEERERLKQLLSNATISVVYSDIYDQEFSYVDDLKWFAE